MFKEKLKFIIFGNEYRKRDIIPCIQRIEQYLGQRHALVAVDPTDLSEADYAISIGGDGTFLKVARRVGELQIPIIGINMGRLGFLADVLPSEIEEALDDIYAGNYFLENHTVIQVETDGEHLTGYPCALNEVAVSKRDTASMISIRTYVNDEFLVNYQADGLIVTTPTGSTAYSLSNGGPVIVPQSRSLCLTPVAPHSLNMRPIVVTDTSVIKLEVESRSHNFLVAMDGRSEKLVGGTQLTIRKAPYSIHVIKLMNRRYFSTLREKLMWGADERQRK